MAGIKNRDPRQRKFQALYSDPKSLTFGNAMQSALKAGYSEAYARNITVKAQGSSVAVEALGQNEKLLAIAKKNLEKAMTDDDNEQVIGMFGPLVDKVTKLPITKRNTKVMAIKADVSKFVAERLDKKNFSPKLDLGGEGAVRPTPILQQFNVYINNGDKENREPAQENQGDSGGKLSE